MQNDLNKTHALGFSQYHIVQPRLLCLRARGIGYVCFAFRFISDKVIKKTTFSLPRGTGDHSAVFLVECAFPNLSAQIRSRSCRPCKDHNTTYHTIQSVDGFDNGFFIPQIHPNKLRHAAGLVCGENPGRFYTHKHPIIGI